MSSLKIQPNKKELKYSIDSNCYFALIKFKNSLYSLIKNKSYKNILFLCIGTDKSTGDSLGPLVGYKLKNLPMPKNTIVLGTLENPVHAKNLCQNIKLIEKKFKNSLIIAIDASLGDAYNINYINIGEGSIKPGAGVKKNLPNIGDLYITGIVNTKNFMDISILQNTRLSTVMNMADIISTGIWHCVNTLD